jgi:hypothetical protein
MGLHGYPQSMTRIKKHKQHPSSSNNNSAT